MKPLQNLWTIFSYMSRVSDSAGRLQQVRDQDFSLVPGPPDAWITDWPLRRHLSSRCTRLPAPRDLKGSGSREKRKKKKRKSRGSSRSFCEIIGTTTGAPNVDTGKNRRRLLEKYLVNCADSRNPPGWHLLDQCVIGSKAKVTLLNRKLWSHDHKWLEWIVL